MRIDPHVHCRHGKYEAYKMTVPLGLQLAHRHGIDIVFDIVNTKDPVIERHGVIERLMSVPDGEEDNYFLYVVIIDDPKQNCEAVDCCEMFPQVVGIKVFACRSVGPLAIIERSKRQRIYKTLVGRKFKGVIVVHSEEETLMRPDLWNPADPTTHSLVRPTYAEVISIGYQIDDLGEAGFQGTLHIPHVTCRAAVDRINEGRKKYDGQMRITCGVTPHHLLKSVEHQKILGFPDGLDLKVNPPLRPEKERLGLVDCVRRGYITCIETDFAPHSPAEKRGPKCLSGIADFSLYNQAIQMLLVNGVSYELIEAMTFGNIVEAFSPKLDHLVQ